MNCRRWSASNWLNAAFESDAQNGEAASSLADVATEFGQPRVTRSAPLRPGAPATIGPGVALWPAAPVTITAPWPAVLEAATADTVILTGTAGAVEVRGALSIGEDLQSGHGVAADSLTLLQLLPSFQAEVSYGPAAGGEGYTFGHSADSYLLDDTGRIVVRFPFTTPPDLIVRDIRRMLAARHLGRR